MLLFIIKVLIVILLAIPTLAWIFFKVYKIERRPDAVFYATTPDGWKIALSRYYPIAQKDRKKRLPVICCHGLSGNHTLYDFSEKLSLARLLSKEGYDVFLLDLRGAGRSDRPDWFTSKSYDWNFTDYLQYDVPTAIDFVLETTGAKQLHWVGHSMGGMLAYATLQTPYAKKIKTATSIAGPMDISQFKPALKIKTLMQPFKNFAIGTLAKSGAPLGEFLPILQKVTGDMGLERGHVARQMANGVENVPTKLMFQFGQWVENNSFQDDTGRDLAAGLVDIKTPIQFIIGEDDLTCFPSSIKGVYEKVGSAKKAYHTLGRDSGHENIYGHNSPLIGRSANKDVYPLILDWIAG